jgi:hypothetical protein
MEKLANKNLRHGRYRLRRRASSSSSGGWASKGRISYFVVFHLGPLALTLLLIEGENVGRKMCVPAQRPTPLVRHQRHEPGTERTEVELINSIATKQ